MKSALEIALEKTKHLDERVKKDAAEVEQQKYTQAARSLGNSFLQGQSEAEKIKESINRYPEKVREAALNAFLTVILPEMDLTNTPRILKAARLLKDDAAAQQACQKAEALYQNQQQQWQEKKNVLVQKHAAEMQEKLTAQGIGGTALAGFNVEQFPAWKVLSTRVQEEYRGLLQSFQAAVLGTKG